MDSGPNYRLIYNREKENSPAPEDDRLFFGFSYKLIIEIDLLSVFYRYLFINFCYIFVDFKE